MEVSGQLPAPVSLPTGKNPGVPNTDPTARLDVSEKSKFSCLNRDFNPGSSSE